MVVSSFIVGIQIFLFWINGVDSMSSLIKQSLFGDSADSVNGYVPSNSYSSINKDLLVADENPTYILSKLSDRELIKLLNDQPKKNEYDLSDIFQVALDSLPKSLQDDSKVEIQSRFEKKENSDQPFFKLNHKEVKNVDQNYNALQKINNLLYNNHDNLAETALDDDDDSRKREILFDKLVAQLKTLCCKRSKKSGTHAQNNNVNLLSHQMSKNIFAQNVPLVTSNAIEHMFLILNDEIKSNGSDELIPVDPESLEKNSSVLLLGPITTPLTDSQIKEVMDRISSELSRPVYQPILQQLSDGTFSNNRLKLIKNLVSGPQTRRYIKPHRCNHQSKITKVYGGPKWIVCSGYLNLNTPSLYD